MLAVLRTINRETLLASQVAQNRQRTSPAAKTSRAFAGSQLEASRLEPQVTCPHGLWSNPRNKDQDPGLFAMSGCVKGPRSTFPDPKKDVAPLPGPPAAAQNQPVAAWADGEVMNGLCVEQTFPYTPARVA